MSRDRFNDSGAGLIELVVGFLVVLVVAVYGVPAMLGVVHNASASVQQVQCSQAAYANAVNAPTDPNQMIVLSSTGTPGASSGACSTTSAP